MSSKPSEHNILAHEVWALFLNVHARLTRTMDDAITSAGLLPLEWYDVLLALYRADGRRLRLSELAERIVFSRSGLTRLIDRIEEKGLLRRERSSEDRRGTFAVLTEAGREAMKRSWPAYRKEIESRFANHLTTAEAVAMRDGLLKVLAANGGGGGVGANEESRPVQVNVRKRS
jgi:DNA-binding MarR family transcriptional regulator